LLDDHEKGIKHDQSKAIHTCHHIGLDGQSHDADYCIIMDAKAAIPGSAYHQLWDHQTAISFENSFLELK
jgi:hypothetical protein